MKHGEVILTISSIVLLVSTTIGHAAAWEQWLKKSVGNLEEKLVEIYGEDQRGRAREGIGQVADFWRAEDGDAAVFEDFVLDNFAGDSETLDAMFGRYERLLELLDGHMNEIVLGFHTQADLVLGPILPFDEVFAAYDPAAHINSDFFKNKLAFVVLLNFPLTTLEQRLGEGENWTRRKWAEARLAQRFSRRVPAEVKLAVARATAEGEAYISGYNIWMHHLLDEEGGRLFPPKMRLLSHWNLRDEIKANYTDDNMYLSKQRMIQKVMERIVTQTIPEVVIDNPHVDWNPYTNEVSPASVDDSGSPAAVNAGISAEREPDTRYRKLLDTFLASRMVDEYSPAAPTLMDRRFKEEREIPETRVEEILVQVVSSRAARRTAELIRSRLGRDLEPFDIWYNGFRPKSEYNEEQLDGIVSGRYPDAYAFRKDIPEFLVKLGFTGERAGYLAENILVEPARGSGHAWGAEMRSQKARLRTRVGKDGMDYKGFNIAVHEMGHNVEQIISLNDVDHTLLRGVPNTAFTEAFAFVFQARDLHLLDLDVPEDGESRALKVLDDFWNVFEIAGVSLVDMEVWRWMYRNPETTPAELREAVIEISKGIWNEYFAPVMGMKDEILLGIYSHMIDSYLYLPDYPIGHLIAFQVEEQMEKAGSIGSEFERMARAGNIAPDLWMKNATGSPVGAEAMLRGADRALDILAD